MSALLGDARPENAVKGLADREGRASRAGRINDATKVVLDSLEAGLQETADVKLRLLRGMPPGLPRPGLRKC